MAKKKQPPTVSSSTKVFEATLGAAGAVLKGHAINQPQAEIRRRAGLDVVVCGSNLAANRSLARQIELNANGTCRRCPPHAASGPKALPHYQPDPGHRPDIRFMKHPTDTPCEPVMKFFTPDLYLRFNSPSDDVADQADEEWEAAVQAYQEHLKSAGDYMPRHVRALSELCLHDCELLAWDDEVAPDPRPSTGPLPVWSAFSVLSLRRDCEVVTINYVLWDKVRRCSAPDGWPFSGSPASWLYDEVDIAKDKHGKFLHRIFFSDGTTAEVPFSIVFVHAVAWEPAHRAVGN